VSIGLDKDALTFFEGRAHFFRPRNLVRRAVPPLLPATVRRLLILALSVFRCDNDADFLTVFALRCFIPVVSVDFCAVRMLSSRSFLFPPVPPHGKIRPPPPFIPRLPPTHRVRFLASSYIPRVLLTTSLFFLLFRCSPPPFISYFPPLFPRSPPHLLFLVALAPSLLF